MPTEQSVMFLLIVLLLIVLHTHVNAHLISSRNVRLFEVNFIYFSNGRPPSNTRPRVEQPHAAASMLQSTDLS